MSRTSGIFFTIGVGLTLRFSSSGGAVRCGQKNAVKVILVRVESLSRQREWQASSRADDSKILYSLETTREG